MGTQGSINALNEYLAEICDKPFVWGSNDCLTFTNDAWRRMHGFGWADSWLKRYVVDGNPMGREALKKEFGFSSIEAAIDERLVRAGKFPPRGALVTTKKARKWVTGVALGICTGQHAAFLDRVGTIYLSLNDIDQSWVNR